MEKLKIGRKLQILIIAVITFLTYANIFYNDFVWDDKDFIPWAGSRDLSNAKNFLMGEVPEWHFGVYRPIRSFIYVVSFELWKTNPIGYHLQSIILHLTATILVYFIVFEITNSGLIAFMSSLIFGVHPIHTEIITPITASFDVFGVIFFLASFLLYLKASFSGKTYLYFISLFLGALSFFTYELALTLPLLIILHDLCFKKGESLLKKAKVYALYLAGALLYFIIRYLVLEIGNRGHYFANSFYYTLLTMSKAFLKYIVLVIFPVNLSVNHHISKGILSLAYVDYNEKAVLAQSIFDLHIMLSIAVIVLLAVIAMMSFKKYPLVSFSIAWFFIALAPVSNIVPQSSIMSEKYLYIASFGFVLLFSYVIYLLYNTANVKHLRLFLILFFALIIVIYSFITITRNKDWKDEYTLWSKAIIQAPDSTLAHNNLGVAYQNQRNDTLAIAEFQKSIQLQPSYDKSHYNLAISYQSLGKLEPAIEEYQKAIALNKDNEKAHINLGAVYQIQGKLDLAIEEYKKAISINPYYAGAHNHLGAAYQIQGKLDLAIGEYKKAISLNPNLADAHSNLGTAYQAQGKLNLAIGEYKKALALNPSDPTVAHNLAVANKLVK